MYALVGRPFRQAFTIPTTFFTSYIFDKVFRSTLRDVAISYGTTNDLGFDGPVLSTVVHSTEKVVVVSSANDTDEVYRYELGQTTVQEGVSTLGADVLGDIFNGTFDVVSENVTQCFMMIGDADPPGETVRQSQQGGVSAVLANKPTVKAGQYAVPLMNFATAYTTLLRASGMKKKIGS